MQTITEKNRDNFLIHFFIFVFLLIFILQNYYYVKMDQMPGFSDGHITFATFYYENFFAGGHNHLSGIAFPPVVYLVTQVFFRLFGFGVESARFSISLFALILFLSVYGVGKEIGNSRLSGLAAMCLAASSPLCLILSRTYLLDLPVAAIAALSLYIHIKSAGFKNRFFSILSGIMLALAFLVKWSAAFCMLVPVLWFFFPVLKQMAKEKKFLFIFFIPLLIVTICITFWFGKSRIADVTNISDWFLYYLIFILTPCLISLILTFYPDKGSAHLTPERVSNIRSIQNFIVYAFVFIITVVPWYMCTASVLRRKFLYDMSVHRDLISNFTSFLTMYEDLFCIANLFMILPVIGIICLFLKKDRGFSTGLMMVVSMLAFFLLFLKIGISITGERYWFIMCIFLFPFAGSWIAYLGRYKNIVTAMIYICSLLAITGWLVKPDIYTSRTDAFESFSDSITTDGIDQARPVGFIGVNPPDSHKPDWEPVCNMFHEIPEEEVVIIVTNLEDQLAYMASESLFMEIKTDTSCKNSNRILRTEILRDDNSLYVRSLVHINEHAYQDKQNNQLKKALLLLIEKKDIKTLNHDMDRLCKENKLNESEKTRSYELLNNYGICVKRINI